VSGGDWPGTLGVSRDFLLRAGGYDGTVMFENLELVRTIIAAGGTELQLSGTFIERRPSSASHFWSQRVRQAYDEFARPGRLLFQLAWLPALAVGGVLVSWALPLTALASTVAIAEAGRRKDGGVRVFPASAPFFAPAWILERSICAWLALAARVVFGGIRYRGTVLKTAATSLRVLRERKDAPNPSPLPAPPVSRYRSA